MLRAVLRYLRSTPLARCADAVLPLRRATPAFYSARMAVAGSVTRYTALRLSYCYGELLARALWLITLISPRECARSARYVGVIASGAEPLRDIMPPR